jgi:TusA-related sulfurtransferase
MTSNKESIKMDVWALKPAAILDLLDTGLSTGAACSTLTPAIKAGILEIDIGQVLMVRVNDPSTCFDVPGWCALTGNVLEAVTQEEGGVLRFYIRKAHKK